MFLIKSVIIQSVILSVLFLLESESNHPNHHEKRKGVRGVMKHKEMKHICMDYDKALRARHKSCFLRADTGPCRADIIQWYFDAKQKKCYRFFWGGCQGNGNRFETQKECQDYCFLNTTFPSYKRPHFCDFAFDYGTCFGHYNRWAYDFYGKSCKHKLYSGCGGNQNNFETLYECRKTCITAPNNTLLKQNHRTTCIPIGIN